jgi:GABA permease
MDPQTPSDGASPRRVLVVANQTAAGDELLAVIERRMREGPCRFTLLVPATHTSVHGTWTEAGDRRIARERMNEAMERFRSAGADLADGMVGDANPVRAIDDALIEQPHDEIILSTLPPGASRWLKLDLPRRVEQRFALPVTTVISQRQLTG